MTIYTWLISALWLIFAAYWAVSALGAKRNAGPRPNRRQRALRLGILVLILTVMSLPGTRRVLQDLRVQIVDSETTGAIGLILCAIGIGLAIWARTCLGRNWGMPMSRKENPELVTSGPYRLVRHPIYAGMLLAMLGSAFGVNVAWVLAFVLFGAYFIYSARREEQLMTEEFPQQYPAYARRTKRLVPFVW
jgi:protein-S-isoprenylcysteine O-methyltransferase Ste14